MANNPLRTSARHANRWLQRAYRSLMPARWLSPIEAYRKAGGDRLLVADLGLETSDTVVDFGGYLGDWAASILQSYGSIIVIFEPVPEFAFAIRERFKSRDEVRVIDAAVGLGPGAHRLAAQADSSGLYAIGRSVTVRAVNSQELHDLLPPRVALASINIEGAEYGLIPQLVDSGLIMRFDRLLIQFHDILGTSPQDYERCRELLGRSHCLDWNFEFVWESWSRVERP